MSFHGFPPETTRFLSEIIADNDKEWFEENKSRYRELILEPTKSFVEEMGEHLQMLVPAINAIPKINQSLFRIYRDARLSPDRPIKERVGMIFWQGGGHRMSSSGFYVQFDTHEILIASGIRAFKPPLMDTYRDYIQDSQKRQELHDILKKLEKQGYAPPEQKYKRLPREFSPEMSYPEVAKLGGVFMRKTIPITKSFNSPEFASDVFAHFKKLHKLQQWVYQMTLHAK